MDVFADAVKWAHEQQAKGVKIQFIVEALGAAMAEICPEGTPNRNAILEAPYAYLAKILGRDPSKFLE